MRNLLALCVLGASLAHAAEEAHEEYVQVNGVAVLNTKDPAKPTASIGKAKFKLALVGQLADPKVFDPKEYNDKKVGFSGRLSVDTITVDEIFYLEPIKKLQPHMFVEIIGTIRRDKEGKEYELHVGKEKSSIKVDDFPVALKRSGTRVLLRGMADIDDTGKVQILLYKLGKFDAK